MAEPAYGTANETEISERSSELVLPGGSVSRSPAARPERKTGLSDSATPSSDPSRHRSARDANRDTTAGDVIDVTAVDSSRLDTAGDTAGDTPGNTPRDTQAQTPATGAALPGDRGPRNQPSQNQRPSFWRRIALGGRRAHDTAAAQTTSPSSLSDSLGSSLPETHPSVIATNPASVETRIVEPMLQALVSVDAKLDRSHVELAGRSDRVEERLTQLWDIDQQLGTLKELQQSLLEVSEQQSRLESTLREQTNTLRWLIGAIFFTVAGAAFVIAALLP